MSFDIVVATYKNMNECIVVLGGRGQYKGNSDKYYERKIHSRMDFTIY
jgi:hypothetical protein